MNYPSCCTRCPFPLISSLLWDPICALLHFIVYQKMFSIYLSPCQPARQNCVAASLSPLMQNMHLLNSILSPHLVHHLGLFSPFPRNDCLSFHNVVFFQDMTRLTTVLGIMATTNNPAAGKRYSFLALQTWVEASSQVIFATVWRHLLWVVCGKFCPFRWRSIRSK